MDFYISHILEKMYLDKIKKKNSLNKKMVFKIKNPKTGKLIKKGGSIHQSLIKEGIDLSKEKSVRKRKFVANESEDKEHLKNVKINPDFKVDKSDVSWKEKKPHSKKERKDLMHKCGEACFLLPSKGKFPICNKLTNENDECSYNCKGLKAASSRAGEWGYKGVLKTSKRLTAELDCYKNKKGEKKEVKENKKVAKQEKKEVKGKKKVEKKEVEKKKVDKKQVKQEKKKEEKKEAKQENKQQVKQDKKQEKKQSSFNRFINFVFG